jgi:ketosteroid isomerase-like protein
MCQPWPVSSNLDLVRSIYADWERGDWSSAGWAHPEIEFVVAGGPAPGSSIGVAGMAKAWGETLSAFRDFRARAEEYHELDDGRVLVLHEWSGRGRTSALSVDRMKAKSATLFHIREGKVTKLIAAWDRDRALAELGLAPEGDVS